MKPGDRVRHRASGTLVGTIVRRAKPGNPFGDWIVHWCGGSMVPVAETNLKLLDAPNRMPPWNDLEALDWAGIMRLAERLPR